MKVRRGIEKARRGKSEVILTFSAVVEGRNLAPKDIRLLKGMVFLVHIERVLRLHFRFPLFCLIFVIYSKFERPVRYCLRVSFYAQGGVADEPSHVRLRFVVVSFARNRNTTPVVKKTLNPVYVAKDATFDFPVYLSLAGRLGVLELIVWDKDMLKKDYLGEASIPLEFWFKEGSPTDFNSPNVEVRLLSVLL